MQRQSHAGLASSKRSFLSDRTRTIRSQKATTISKIINYKEDDTNNQTIDRANKQKQENTPSTFHSLLTSELKLARLNFQKLHHHNSSTCKTKTTKHEFSSHSPTKKTTKKIKKKIKNHHQKSLNPAKRSNYKSHRNSTPKP